LYFFKKVIKKAADRVSTAMGKDQGVAGLQMAEENGGQIAAHGNAEQLGEAAQGVTVLR